MILLSMGHDLINKGGNMKLFTLGKVVVTRAVSIMLFNWYRGDLIPKQLLNMHSQGDFGNISEEDKQLNLDAIKNNDGGRIMSSYLVNGATSKEGKSLPNVTFWIITEGTGEDRVTTILFPEEY